MDFRLGDMLGTDATKKILAVLPDAKIIMVTGEVSEALLVSAIEAGCAGYLTKGSDLLHLRDAVRKAHEGEPLISPDMLPRILRRIRAEATREPVTLSPREREVLQLMSEGKSNDQIAAELFVSVHTVRSHVQNIIQKLGAHSKLETVAMAVRSGLVRLD